MSKEFLVGIYKEVGKDPYIIKIKNQKEYLEPLVGGEYATFDHDDYVIIYKKKSDNLLANVYIDRYSKIGISIKGKIFVVGKDKKGNFISLNKGQFLRCADFLMKESFNYKNFDEHGKYIPKSKRINKKIFHNDSIKNMSKFNENKKLDINKQDLKSKSSVALSNIPDEQILEMIIKIIFPILEFVKNSLEDPSNEE